jgi:hypothetical protein
MREKIRLRSQRKKSRLSAENMVSRSFLFLAPSCEKTLALRATWMFLLNSSPVRL